MDLVVILIVLLPFLIVSLTFLAGTAEYKARQKQKEKADKENVEGDIASEDARGEGLRQHWKRAEPLSLLGT